MLIIDHRPKMNPAYDQTQGESGCEPNAAVNVFEYYLPAPKQDRPWYGWSRSGISSERDTIEMRRMYPDPVERTVEATNFYGLLTESEWHTDEENGNKLPPADLLRDKGRRRLFNAAKLTLDFDQVKRGPLLLRILACHEFRTVAGDGIMAPQVSHPSPNPHQVVLAGKRPDGRYIILNSWGTGWGHNGCIYVRGEELEKMAISLWMVNLKH